MSKALKVGFQQVLGRRLGRHSPKKMCTKANRQALNAAVIGGGGEALVALSFCRRG